MTESPQLRAASPESTPKQLDSGAPNHTEANAFPASSIEFLKNNCLDCHDGDSGEGDFNLRSLKNDLHNEATMQRWIRVLDRVEQGEMPPPEDSELTAADRKDFVKQTALHVVRVQQELQRQVGRVQGRRLTNEQLQRTLQDLLRIDLPLARLMPEEQRTGGFVHLADTQTMSHFQLQAHLRVVDAALDAAFDRATKAPSDWEVDLPAKQIANKRKGKRNREPELRQGLAVVWSGKLVFYGRISSTTVPHDGWYRITLTASAVKKPKEHGVWCSVRSGECVSSAPLMTWIGAFEAEDKPKTVTFDAWIPEGHRLEVRPADVTLKQANFQGGQVGFGEGEPQNVPGIAMHHLTVQQIHPGGEVKDVRQQLLGDLSLKWNKKANQSTVDLRKYPEQKLDGLLEEQMVRFASEAFRRPVTSKELTPYITLAQALLSDSDSSTDLAFMEALRGGYRAILCSPRFLYLTEPADSKGQLDDWAIASRLSYFLTGSQPDAELREAATNGQLNRPKQIQSQADRILKTKRGQDFVKDFSAQWLDLVDIDFTEPDRRLFREFDIVVQDSMLNEAHQFLQKQLEQNRPARELVDADYTFLNSRLARYYELPDINGDELRLVSLKPDSPRGGLLSQGAILKVTANGNDTSPVLRGIWVSERILGCEIPNPPSSVPAVEPDVRGATTIRELLEKHQADVSCAACHKNIDPPGFALESFDAGGRWRERYLKVDGKRYKRGPKVDPSFVMPNGEAFDSFAEFRTLIGKRDRDLAANLASQLLVYATGAPIRYADRPIIQKVVDQTESTQHGFRSILHQVVTSEAFLMK